MDMRKYQTDVRKLLRRTILESVVEGDGKWTSEHGKLIVGGLITGIVLQELWEYVRKSAELVRVVDNPDPLFESMSKEGVQQHRRSKSTAILSGALKVRSQEYQATTEVKACRATFRPNKE